MKYSIITVNYNNRNGLRKTIESVIHQTYRDFGYIIIDGGSTDGSTDVLKEYDSYITYWVSEPDKGIYNAMNKGITKASGDYLNFMNSGDCFFDRDVLQKMINSKLSTEIIIGKDYWYNPNTKKDFTTILPLRIDMFTFYKGSLPHQSTFFKRTLFNDTLYDEKLKVVSDWKFYILKIIGEGCSFSYFNDVICKKDSKDGVGCTLANLAAIERENFISSYLPIGIQNHYKTITKLDSSTFYKFLKICDSRKSSYLLTMAIKIIYRLLHKSTKK